MLTVITKRPEISTPDFRRFVRDEYGPVYQAMPQVRSYTQYFLSPVGGAGTGPDAVVQIAFDSPEAMTLALDTDAYRAAAQARGTYMSIVSAAVLDAVVELA